MKTLLRWVCGVVVISIIITGVGMMSIAGFVNDHPDSTSLTVAQEAVPASTIVHENQQPNTHIFAMGDIMLGRYVETLIEKNGSRYPFEHVRDMLRGYDMVIANLEGPIVEDAPQTPNGSLVFSFPASATDVLTSAYITHVSLANNHTLNYGAAGYEETAERLKSAGITSYGNPSTIDEAHVYRGNTAGREIILIGFLNLQKIDKSKLTELISSYSEESFVIVTPHWGNEYSTTSSLAQQTLAHELIDAGTDVIIGHHPHVVQEIEQYNGNFIFYSLGNAVFDQYFSEETQKGLGVEILLDNQRVEYTLHPLTSERSQLQPMTTDEARTFLEGLSQRSAKAPQDQIIAGTVVQTVERATPTEASTP
ncbi:MAG: CapA family protein [Parcubacteria group bacterium]